MKLQALKSKLKSYKTSVIKLLMKYSILFFFVLKSFYSFSQLAEPSGMGSKNFDHLYAEIKTECGFENEYAGIKFKKKKIKKDLLIVRIVNKIMLAELTLQQADSILKRKGFKPFTNPYNQLGYDANKMIINGTFIKFSVISATKKEVPITFLGATLKSTYEIHCKSNPLFIVPSVDIDVDFFRKKVMKKISCRYQVFNDLALGAASYMWNELHFIF
jgi:hypothetical protein